METWEQELQAHKAQLNSFEGWYFRICDKNFSMAIIVGISFDENDPHSFIQTIDTISKKTQYVRFLREELILDELNFRIQIQKNMFSVHGMILHLEGCEIPMFAAFTFESITKLKSNMYAPTIMGPFAYLPRMECVHSIISTHHVVSGNMNLQGRSFLVHGSGYIEKDRGISFPKRYIWIQSNECEEGSATFFISIADIPFSGICFQGVIALLQVNSKQYRFGTYYGAYVQIIKKQPSELFFIVRQGKWKLYVQLYTNERYPLIAPKCGKMGPKLMEGLEGKAIVQLIHYNTHLMTLHFSHCGNEVRCN